MTPYSTVRTANPHRTLPCDFKLQNMFEGIVIKWSCLIEDILSHTSEKLFHTNQNPLPIAELTYWTDRSSNLNNVYAQLMETSRKMVGIILEQINSVYSPTFRQFFVRTVAAVKQAQHICCHLNAFAKCTQQIQCNSFADLSASIRPLVHCMCIMWTESIYYPKENWLRLLKMIGNLLINESMDRLESESLFQNDIEDSLIKINETIAVLEHFK